MGDPGKYTRRREQLEQRRRVDEPWEVLDEVDPMHLRVQWPWECVASSMSGLVVASVAVLVLAVLAQSC